MFTKSIWPLTILAIAGFPFAGHAQGLETLGTRAAGLSAFVAVADDASAVAWNPAGLVFGPIFNISLDLGRSTSADESVPAFPRTAGQAGTTLLAVAAPALGLSYYRIGTTQLEASPEDSDPVSREDRQVVVRTLKTSHVGATILQSLGDFVTLGATLKLVRGSVAADVVTIRTWDEGFERADTLETSQSTTGDLDVGAMFAVQGLRAGLVVRNVTEPTFGDDDSPDVGMSLDRHARVGVAWGDPWPGMAGVIVALDADITRVRHPAGDRRDVAAGVEGWLRGQQIGVRGGVRASTVGDARPVVSAGASYAVRVGTYVDAFVARGTRDDSAWGIAARMTF